MSFGRSSLPCNRRFIRSWFARKLSWINGRTATDMPMRRCCHWLSNEGQGNNRCTISTIPSFVGHIGFMVSLKLYSNLWIVNVLRPTLIWEICDKPNGSWCLRMDFTGGWIIYRSWHLNIAMDWILLIWGSSLFHSDMQLEQKLDWTLSVIPSHRSVASWLWREWCMRSGGGIGSLLHIGVWVFMFLEIKIINLFHLQELRDSQPNQVLHRFSYLIFPCMLLFR